MDPIKISNKDLDSLYNKLHAGDDGAIGNYLYKGLRIQISMYRSSGTDRYMRLYKKRRENGLCIRCGKKVTKHNHSTGALYRLCEYHRETTDKRN